MDSIDPSKIKLSEPPFMERLMVFVRTWKIPLSVGSCVVVLGGIAGVIFFTQHAHLHTTTSSPSNPYANDSSEVSSNPVVNPATATRSADFPFIYNSKANNVAPPSRRSSSGVTEANPADLAHPSPYNLPPQYITPIPGSHGSSSSNPSNGNSNNNSGSSGSSSGSSGGLTSDPSQAPDTPVTIYFQDPGSGDITSYPPPSSSSPTFAIVWKRYVNQADHYAIDYPAEWSLIKTVFNGHEGLNLFPPGENTNDLSAFRIGLGWNTKYLLPIGTATQAALRQPLFLSGQNGTLYTQGSIGQSYIAAVLNDAGGQFGIASNASTDLMTYVFQHMISSIQIVY